MILRLYAGVTCMASPWLRRMLARRAGRGKEIPHRLAEREGVASLPRPAGRLVWLHAASVGEMMSALPLLELLATRGTVLLTTGTVTSANLAAQRLPQGVIHQFIPLDTPAWTARFLEYWCPDAALFMESEIWPNLLSGCDQRRVPRFLINGRLSSSSARYWRWMPGMARQLLGGFRAVHAQSAADAARFRAMGAKRVLEWGNLKSSTKPLPCAPGALPDIQRLIPGFVWLAASTHPGEEDIIYTVHQSLLAAFPGLVTVIVPRHPERGGEVAALCAGAPRRSLGQPPLPGQVYVADTLGELGLFFRLASFAFIGNSLIAGGGHNLIEPAKLARPVICGPSMENFIEARDCMAQAQALIQVGGQDDLAAAVQSWLSDPSEAKAAGERAAMVFSKAEKLPEQLANLVLEEGV